MECKCKQCGMSVKGFKCGKCNEDMVADSVAAKDGQKANVVKCPKGCGMIKAPSCCGHEMSCAM